MRSVKHADHVAGVVAGPRKLAAEDRQAFEGVGANGLAHWLSKKQDISIDLLACCGSQAKMRGVEYR